MTWEISVPYRLRKEQKDQNGCHAREPGEDAVFPSNKGIGARLDQRGNLNDPLIFRRLLFHPEIQIGGKGKSDDHCKKGNNNDKLHKRSHKFTPFQTMLTESWLSGDLIKEKPHKKPFQNPL